MSMIWDFSSKNCWKIFSLIALRRNSKSLSKMFTSFANKCFFRIALSNPSLSMYNMVFFWSNFIDKPDVVWSNPIPLIFILLSTNFDKTKVFPLLYNPVNETIFHIFDFSKLSFSSNCSFNINWISIKVSASSFPNFINGTSNFWISLISSFFWYLISFISIITS